MKKLFLIFGMISFFTIALLCPPIYPGTGSITITFYQAQLSLVLQSLSKMTGIKLITNAELGEKPISAYLENVSGEEAIDSILKANSLYREKIEGSNIYVVKSIPASAPALPRLESETFFLQYAKADNLGKVLSPLIGTGEQIIPDARTNSITVRAFSSTLEELKNIIRTLDKNVPQVSIEAVLVELTNDSLKDLGIKWNVQGDFFGPAHDVATPWSKNPALDVVGPTTGTTGTGTGATAPQFIMGRLSFEALTANLKFLEEKGEANILANPRITALNDTPATIKITKNMAIAPKITETEEGGRTITEYEYRDVGVSLKVIPNINEKGDITLDIEPTVSSAARSTVFTDAVDTNERTAKTKVMVKDGETIVIGGLLRKDTVKSKSKVPILGDILPFLFSQDSDQVSRSDLVIFLTPKIITAEQVKITAEEEKKRIGAE
ncbi:MAG TPA: secretin N-terminal domain-containing protein [bacterium]|nr:secretin N-terminal domain-containing protein [bacterium]